MKTLKSILMNTFFVTQVLGAGEGEILIQSSHVSPESLVVQDVFSRDMGHCRFQNNYLTSFQVNDTGMEMLSFLSAEDLKNWITAFSCLVPKENRNPFIKSMNANFFGGFYPRSQITRISRPVDSPDVYIPFEYPKMQKIFSKLNPDEIKALLNPFFKDLLKNSNIPQGERFLMSAIGIPYEKVIAEGVMNFFKNPLHTEIPRSLLLSPKFIRILGEKIQKQQIHLTEKSRITTEDLYLFGNYISASNDKLAFVSDFLEMNQHPTDLKAFGYLCVMQDLAIDLKDRFKAVESLKDLGVEYHAQIAGWVLYIMHDLEIDLKSRFKAVEYLKSLNSPYRAHVAPWCISIMNDLGINLKDKFRALDHLKDLGLQYDRQQSQVYISIIKNREVDINDKFRALNSLKNLGEKYYKDVAQGYASIMEDSRLDIKERMKSGNFLKKLGKIYSKQLIQGYGSIIKDLRVDTKQRFSSSNSFKLDKSYSQKLAQEYGSIMKDSYVDIKERFRAADHLTKLGKIYNDYLVQGYKSIVNDLKLDKHERSKAENLLKGLLNQSHYGPGDHGSESIIFHDLFQ